MGFEKRYKSNKRCKSYASNMQSIINTEVCKGKCEIVRGSHHAKFKLERVICHYVLKDRRRNRKVEKH